MEYICKHECPNCGIEWQHPFIPVDMPKCDRKDYLLECSYCRIKKEMLR